MQTRKIAFKKVANLLQKVLVYTLCNFCSICELEIDISGIGSKM